MTRTKTYEGYLIVDWRDGELRFRKTKPSKSERGATEYPVKVEVEVEVPDYDIPTLAAEMQVPEAAVRQAVASDLYAEGELPEWHDTVEKGMGHFADEARGLDPSEVAYDELLSKFVGYVMRNAEGYPPVDEVETTVDERLREVAL